MKRNKGFGRTFFRILCLFIAFTTLSPKKLGDHWYPERSLRCYSTLTDPANLLICPETANKFCIKEVAHLSQEQCGKTIFFGDRWDQKTSQCIWRKCSDKCNAGASFFLYKGEQYMREQYCCNNIDFCNSARTKKVQGKSIIFSTGVITVALKLIQYALGN